MIPYSDLNGIRTLKFPTCFILVDGTFVYVSAKVLWVF